MDIVALYECSAVARSVSGVYLYRSGMINGFRLKGVVMDICQLLPFVVEVTPIDGRMMRVRLKHKLVFMSLVEVYAPIEMCETE